MHIRNQRSPFAVALLLLWPLAMLSASTAAAQPVARSIDLAHPAASIAYETAPLTAGRPRVAILRSRQTMERVPGMKKAVEEAVYQWEILLLGLQIPYTVLDDADIGHRIPKDIRVLVLPAAESLSPRQRDRLRRFAADGGGLLASGRTGYYDETGRRTGGAFLSELLSTRIVDALPRQIYGQNQSIEYESPVTRGVPAGFRLRIAALGEIVAAGGSTPRTLGHLEPFENEDRPAFDGLSLIAYAPSGEGSVFWTRFLPQHVARMPDQQDTYQRLVVNAIADAAALRSVSIERWKEGRRVAVSLAALPAPGFDAVSYLTNYDRFVDFLERTALPASFYFTSGEIMTFPDLYGRIVATGSEVAVSADTDSMLVGMKRNRQVERLSKALDELLLTSAYGFYPPGGFLDANTIRALDRFGAVYVLDARSTGYEPAPFDRWRYVDYRESFESGQEAGIRPAPGGADSRGRASGRRSIQSIPFVDFSSGDYEAWYERVKTAGGHLVVPYYPEITPAYSVTADRLKRLMRRAADEGAWMTTVAGVLDWKLRRENVRPSIVSVGKNEMQLEVENLAEDAIDGVWLTLRFPDGLPGSFECNDPNLMLHADHGRNELRIGLGALSPGSMSFSVFWKS